MRWPGKARFRFLQGQKGFTYTDNSSGGLTDLHPQTIIENINGVDRLKLLRTEEESPEGNTASIAAGDTLYLTFLAQTTKDVSGSYYNEGTVVPKDPHLSVTDKKFQHHV